MCSNKTICEFCNNISFYNRSLLLLYRVIVFVLSLEFCATRPWMDWRSPRFVQPPIRVSPSRTLHCMMRWARTVLCAKTRPGSEQWRNFFVPLFCAVLWHGSIAPAEAARRGVERISCRPGHSSRENLPASSLHSLSAWQVFLSWTAGYLSKTHWDNGLAIFLPFVQLTWFWK